MAWRNLMMSKAIWLIEPGLIRAMITQWQRVMISVGNRSGVSHEISNRRQSSPMSHIFDLLMPVIFLLCQIILKRRKSGYQETIAIWHHFLARKSTSENAEWNGHIDIIVELYWRAARRNRTLRHVAHCVSRNAYLAPRLMKMARLSGSFLAMIDQWNETGNWAKLTMHNRRWKSAAEAKHRAIIDVPKCLAAG